MTASALWAMRRQRPGEFSPCREREVQHENQTSQSEHICQDRHRSIAAVCRGEPGAAQPAHRPGPDGTEQAALQEEVDAYVRENAELSYKIEHSEDEDIIEDIARNELGLVEPGEKIFIDVSN